MPLRSVWVGVVAVLGAGVMPVSGQEAVPGPGTRWVDSLARIPITAEVLVTGLQKPTAIASLSDGALLLAERDPARLSLGDASGRSWVPVAGLPPMSGGSGGGLLDLAVAHGRLYLLYSVAVDGGNTVRVASALVDRRATTPRLDSLRVLFTSNAVLPNDEHFGGRLALADGFLFIAVGDRHTQALAQALDSHAGKVLRLHDDGRVPRDNPFVGRPGVAPEIWTLGHRNPQGLAVDPRDGTLWEHEHGPWGGDELNRLEPGRNYGWPDATMGLEYDGTLIRSSDASPASVVSPTYYWAFSAAPSGLLFHDGRGAPEWAGLAVVGFLASRHPSFLRITDGVLRVEQRVLVRLRWRTRAVGQRADGAVLVGTDEGWLVVLEPWRPSAGH
jgi:aldose sugar dehydrogenase